MATEPAPGLPLKVPNTAERTARVRQIAERHRDALFAIYAECAAQGGAADADRTDGTPVDQPRRHRRSAAKC